MLSPTLRSDIVKFGTSAFVLSDSKHSTPSRPISAIFVKLAGSPTGVKSNLKSPVCTILPGGVFTTIPYASGILCVVRKKLTEVFLNLITSSSLNYIIFVVRSKPCSSNLFRNKPSASFPP